MSNIMQQDTRYLVFSFLEIDYILAKALPWYH